MPQMPKRRLPVGAEPRPAGGVDFRVWAPLRRTVRIVLEGNPVVPTPFELREERGGYFSGFIEEARPGTIYRFRLDDEEPLYPDPASRYQPDGPHGPSCVVDPTAFDWTDGSWTGVEPGGRPIYEMHIGTFTREGTWKAAAGHLHDLAELGIGVVEIMPVADFDGMFGWGYDGVNFFAPTRLYGAPDDFRDFVDTAHDHGLAVILDVVYNHIGPSGNFLGAFSSSYVKQDRESEWGDSVNFDGRDSGPVREFVLANVAHWIDEYHLDGLRLDATQQIFDDSAIHILSAIGERAREAAGDRNVILVAENEPQQTRLIRPRSENGYGLDHLWNDDFHHSARVALTGQREAYYSDYLGTPHELLAAALRGFLYQGQWYAWQNQPRGSSTRGLPRHAFVCYLENHDQVANSATGSRLHRLGPPARYRAITALLLLAPWTPMLFQGQEFASSAPFLYFADHDDELAAAVRHGRAAFLGQFPSLASPEAQRRLADPADRGTFESCKLDDREREENVAARALHRDLLRLRRHDPVLSSGARIELDGAVLTDAAFLLRFRAPSGERLLVVNLGHDTWLSPNPEPLLAPPERQVWGVLWQSDAWEYGGMRQPAGQERNGWRLPAESAVVFAPGPATAGTVSERTYE